jgi:chromosome segregation ATPase
VRAVLSVNPWTYVAVLCVLTLYTLHWGRTHMVTKRGVRAQREALREDARACGARLTTMEDSLFVKNKEFENIVRELDSLKQDHERRSHELYQARGEADACRDEANSLKKNIEAMVQPQPTNSSADAYAAEAEALRKELKSAKFQIESLRHEKVGLELDLQRAKHEALFTREHIKEEILKEDIEAIETLIKEDIKKDEAREAAGEEMEMKESVEVEAEVAEVEVDSEAAKEDEDSHDIDI